MSGSVSGAEIARSVSLPAPAVAAAAEMYPLSLAAADWDLPSPTADSLVAAVCDGPAADFPGDRWLGRLSVSGLASFVSSERRPTLLRPAAARFAGLYAASFADPGAARAFSDAGVSPVELADLLVVRSGLDTDVIAKLWSAGCLVSLETVSQASASQGLDPGSALRLAAMADPGEVSALARLGLLAAADPSAGRSIPASGWMAAAQLLRDSGVVAAFSADPKVLADVSSGSLRNLFAFALMLSATPGSSEAVRTWFASSSGAVSAVQLPQLRAAVSANPALESSTVDEFGSTDLLPFSERPPGAEMLREVVVVSASLSPLSLFSSGFPPLPAGSHTAARWFFDQLLSSRWSAHPASRVFPLLRLAAVCSSDVAHPLAGDGFLSGWMRFEAPLSQLPARERSEVAALGVPHLQKVVSKLVNPSSPSASLGFVAEGLASSQPLRRPRRRGPSSPYHPADLAVREASTQLSSPSEWRSFFSLLDRGLSPEEALVVSVDDPS